MAITFFPFDAGAGANVVETQWSLMARFFIPNGVVGGYLNQLNPTVPGGSMNVNIASGMMIIQGFIFHSDATEAVTLTTANPTLERLDFVVVRLDLTANTMSLVALAGTPGSGSPPALTQTSTTWEIPIVRIRVPAAATSPDAFISDRRVFTGQSIFTGTPPTLAFNGIAPKTWDVLFNTITHTVQLFDGTNWNNI
jgi:hypothetical protein